jgi:hypothetical protein
MTKATAGGLSSPTEVPSSIASQEVSVVTWRCIIEGIDGAEGVAVFTLSLCTRVVLITHICSVPLRGENFLMTGFFFSVC